VDVLHDVVERGDRPEDIELLEDLSPWI